MGSGVEGADVELDLDQAGGARTYGHGLRGAKGGECHVGVAMEIQPRGDETDVGLPCGVSEEFKRKRRRLAGANVRISEKGTRGLQALPEAKEYRPERVRGRCPEKQGAGAFGREWLHGELRSDL